MRPLTLILPLSTVGCGLFSKEPDATATSGGNGAPPGGSGAACATTGWVEGGPYEPVILHQELITSEEDVPGVGPMRVLKFVPDNPVGVLWVFHGTGGDLGVLQQIEYYRIYNALLDDGFAIVATESLERGSGAQWDYTVGVGNPDIQRLDALRTFLIDTTPLEEDTPTFALGFSNGSNFTGIFMDAGFTLGWDMRAASGHSAAPMPVIEAPTILFEAENDEQIGEAVMDGAYEAQLDAGYLSDFYIHLEHALDPAEMQKIPQLDAEESQLAFDEAVRLGLIDENGDRAFDLPDLEHFLDVYNNQATVQWKAVIVAQLRVVFATHRVNGEHYKDERNRFVCDALGWGDEG